jgi:hypothetical protein
MLEVHLLTQSLTAQVITLDFLIVPLVLTVGGVLTLLVSVFGILAVAREVSVLTAGVRGAACSPGPLSPPHLFNLHLHRLPHHPHRHHLQRQTPLRHPGIRRLPRSLLRPGGIPERGRDA